MRPFFAACGSAALLWTLELAGCVSNGGALTPGDAMRGAAAPSGDRHVKIRLFDDTYGDPTPQGITAGPDGALWFTAAQSDAQIGRITTAGAVTLFPDSGGSFPQGITAGTDRALWFAESNGTVGRMTVSGSVTHYTVAPSNATLEGIVQGTDGAFWITQYIVGGSRFSNRVIRLTRDGKHRAFNVGFGPDFICVGPDGALYFTEASAVAIGRLSTTSAYREFPIDPRDVQQPSGITTGADGALWFTNFSGNPVIGRMTTAGKMTFYPFPASGAAADEIAPGPDGRLWFTNMLGPSAIGRVTLR